MMFRQSQMYLLYRVYAHDVVMGNIEILLSSLLKDNSLFIMVQ